MSRITYPAPVPPGSPIRPVPAIQFAGGPLALHITQKLHAGFPSPAADYTADPLELNQYLVDRVACTFLFDVAGWSMSGAHIVEGDKVVVDRSISPQPGHIVVAIVNGGFTIKRLRLVNGAYELRPENPDSRPIRLGEGEVLEVFGVVVSVNIGQTRKQALFTGVCNPPALPPMAVDELLTRIRVRRSMERRPTYHRAVGPPRNHGDACAAQRATARKSRKSKRPLTR